MWPPWSQIVCACVGELCWKAGAMSWNSQLRAEKHSSFLHAVFGFNVSKNVCAHVRGKRKRTGTSLTFKPSHTHELRWRDYSLNLKTKMFHSICCDRTVTCCIHFINLSITATHAWAKLSFYPSETNTTCGDKCSIWRLMFTRVVMSPAAPLALWHLISHSLHDDRLVLNPDIPQTCHCHWRKIMFDLHRMVEM